MTMLLTDIREVKGVLDIDPEDKSEDWKLLLFIEQASEWISEYLDRPGLEKKSRTEYYNGTGTQKLLLRSRPVYTSPTILVRLDESAYYGSATDSFDAETALTYGEDFALELDQEDGTSRSGILVRIGDVWPKASVRQRGFLSPFVGEGFGVVRVTYTAGYTVDTLPAIFRLACNLLVAKMRYLIPPGMEIGSESYEERSVSYVNQNRNILMSLVKPLLNGQRNWKF